MSERITRRGVYKDLSISPYGYTSPYGDSFKFSSAKRLEMYTRDIDSEIERLEKVLDRHRMKGFLPDEIITLLRRSVYKAFYKQIEG